LFWLAFLNAGIARFTPPETLDEDSYDQRDRRNSPP